MEIESAVSSNRKSSKLFGSLIKPVQSIYNSSNEIDKFWNDIKQRNMQLTVEENKATIEQQNVPVTVIETEVKSTCNNSIFSSCVNLDNDCIHTFVFNEQSIKTQIEPDQAELSFQPIVSPILHVPNDVIIRFRLSLDEIRQLPKFRNYSAGQPSKVSSINAFISLLFVF